MALENNISVISLSGGEEVATYEAGSRTVAMAQPSVVHMQGSPAMVARYERAGNDLILHMKDGSTVRYQNFFLSTDAEQSELVFDDGESQQHAVFPFAELPASSAEQTIVPTYEVVETNDNTPVALALAALGGLLAVGAAAFGGSGGGGNHHNNVFSGSNNGNNGGGNNGGGNNGGGNNGGGNNGGGNNGGGNNGGGNNGGGNNGGGNNGGGNNGGGNNGGGDAPTVTIITVGNDAYINALEHQQPLLISGTTTHMTAGSSVQITLNGKSYTATIQANGSWSFTVPAQDVQQLPDGKLTVTAKVQDAAGKTGQDTHDITVIASVEDLPTITVNTVAGDDVINAQEAQSNVIISGTTTHVTAGQKVTITIQGKDYTTTVDASGNWSFSLPPSAAQGLNQGEQTITVKVSDVAGNTATDSHTVDVDTVPPLLTIDIFIKDNILNYAESLLEQILSGTADPDAKVTVKIGDSTTVVTADGEGHWELAVSAEELAALLDGSVTITASVTDEAGNETTVSSTLNVATHELPVPTLNTPFGDGILNQAEADATQTLSGTTGVSGLGQTFTVNIGGKDYTATVDINGSWTLQLTSSDLQGLDEGSVSITVTVSDFAGNSTELNSTFVVDTTPPTLTVGTIAGDGVINAAEALAAILISGTASLSEAGQTVHITLVPGGGDYTGVVQGDGTWQITLPAGTFNGLSDGNITVKTSLSDTAGNSISDETSVTLNASSNSFPTVDIVAVGNDAYVNATEHQQPLVISGTTTGMAEGQLVTITLNEKTYTAEIQEDGSWSYTIPALDVQQLPDGPITVSTKVVNSVGNPATDSQDITVIASPGNLPTITINTVAGDDVINVKESESDVVISGTTTHVTEGQEVTITLDGKEYTTTVDSSGYWSFSVPSSVVEGLDQGLQTITVEVSDVAGNSVSGSHNVVVDTVPPLLSIDIFVNDNILNYAEALLGQLLSGSTDPDAKVSITIGSKTTIVTADSEGHWELAVSATDLLALEDGSSTITVKVTDEAGNSTEELLNITVATHNLPALTLDPMFGDGLLSIAEMLDGGALTGSCTNLPIGTVVSVTIGGDTYTGSVTTSGHWTVNIPAGVLSGLDNGPTEIVVTAQDSYGNQGSAHGSLDVHLQAPLAVLTLPLFGDGILNLAEALAGQTLTGSSGLIGAGQSVYITLDGVRYDGTVNANGNWSVQLPPDVLQGLLDTGHSISVTLTDAAGNHVTCPDLSFTSVIHNIPAPTLDLPFGDGILNHAEALLGGELSGSTGVIGLGQTVIVSVNGIPIEATVDANGHWTLPLDSTTLLGLQDGSWTITIKATDSAGNSTTVSDTLQVLINHLPNATINTPFGDGVLNLSEASSAAGQVISGTTGLTGPGQTVVVTLDGVPQTVTVNDAGQWSITLGSGTLTGLDPNVPHDIHVKVTDSAGNVSEKDLSFNAYLTLPTPSFDPVGNPFLDGYLNLSEAGQTIVLTGKTGITGTGQGVMLTINLGGVSYPVTIDSNGNWTATIDANALLGLNNGSHTLTLTATDAAGNSNSVDLPFNAQLTLPQPTINLPFGDGYLNENEASITQVITGSLGVAAGTPGVTVQVTIAGGTPIDAINNGDGTWSLELPLGSFIGIDDGVHYIVVTVKDAAGNSSSADYAVHFSLTPPTITVGSFAGDNALNYAESLLPQVLSGTTSAEVGQTVTITLGGQTFTTKVQEGGVWSLTLQPTELDTLTSGTLQVSVTDKAGNTNSTPLTSITVDLTTVDPSLSINPIGGDGYLNFSELNGQTTFTVSGKSHGVLPPGIVLVYLNDMLVGSPSVDINGNWSVNVSTLDLINGDGSYTVKAQTSLPIMVDIKNVIVDTVAPTITIGTFAGNDRLNSTEAQASLGQTISGTTSGGVVGRQVTVSLNGKDYHTVVQGDGSWSVTVPKGDLSQLPQGANTITASVSDAAGNPGSASHPIQVDTIAPLLTVDVLGVGNVLTALEALVDLLITGTGNAGDTIRVSLGGTILTATVGGDNKWQVSFTPEQLVNLVDGPITIGVTSTDAAGNVTSANVGLNVAINSLLGVGAGLVFGGDGILNLAESLLTQVISGTATGNYAGATVSLTIAGQTLTAQVGPNGKWSLSLDPSLWAGLIGNTLALDLSITDANGNVAHQLINTQLALTNLPTINSVVAFGDGLLNLLESTASQLITGVIGNWSPGVSVTVTLGTQTYGATVLPNGTWSVSIPSNILSGLSDGITTVGVKVTDTSGNSVQQNVNVNVITHNLPTISLNPLFGDGTLSITELLGALSIGGTSTGLAGRTISVNIAGAPTLSAVVNADGTWSVALTPSVIGILQGIGSGNVTVSVSASDVAGNPANTSVGLHLDLLPPLLGSITLFGDGLLNATDATLTQTISGVLSNAPIGTVVTIKLGNSTLVGVVTQADGSFSINVLPSVLSQLPDGNLTANINITTPDGNSTNTTANVQVGLKNLPVVSLDPLFGNDGFLNQVEAAAGQLISGTVTNLTSGQVAINVGGTLINATINPNGTWSVLVPGSVLSNLPDGTLSVSASVVDAVGNSNSASASLNAIIHKLPSISIGSLFGDGLLSVVDLLTAQTISGTSSNLSVGTQILVTIGSSTYNATVGANGAWSLSLSPAILSTIQDGSFTVSVSVKDAAGNQASSSSLLQVTAHQPPTLSLTNIFGNDGLSAADLLSVQTISGTSTNAQGSTVNITIGTQVFHALVGSDGSWSVSVSGSLLSGLLDGNYTVSASVTNGAGNTVSASSPLTVITHNLPTVTLNQLFGDGGLNIADALAGQVLGGTLTNAIGATVTVTVGGVNFNATVGPNGTWSLSLPNNILQSLPNGNLQVDVTVRDAAGNTSSAHASAEVKLTAPQLSYNPLSLLNVTQLLNNGLTITGNSRYLGSSGKLMVSVLGLAGVAAQVSDNGTWTVTLHLTLTQLLSLTLASLVKLEAVDSVGNGVSVEVGLGTALVLPPLVQPTALAHDALATDGSGHESSTSATTSEHTDTARTAASTPASTPAESESHTTESSAVESLHSLSAVLSSGVQLSGEAVVGSAGNDEIHLSSLGFSHIDGGAGIDTLILAGNGLNLDLTALGDKVQNIDIINLGLSASNGITLDLNSSLNVTDRPSDSLIIQGDDDDWVNLVSSHGDTWSVSGQREVGGVTYDVYHNSAQEGSTLGDVLIQHGLHVNLV